MKKTIARVLVLMLILSFTVSTAMAFTPPGLNKKGGLPPGLLKRFIERIEDKQTYDTTIKDINVVEKRIVIQEGTALIHLLVADNAKIQLNGKTAALKDLQIKDKVQMKTNSSNTIIEIKATGGTKVVPVPGQTKVTGLIKSIDQAKKEIILEGNNVTSLYRLTNDLIYLDNKSTTMANLKVGMEVTVNLDGTIVKSVYAKSLVVKEVKAVVKSIDLVKREMVLQYDNKEELYSVKADAVIKINGVVQNLSAIGVGTNVTVKVSANEISEILVTEGLYQLEGRLLAKYTGTTPSVVVEINSEQKTFNVKKDLDMSHVNVGKQVIIYIQDNVVIAIHDKI